MLSRAVAHGRAEVTYPQGQVLIDLAREFKTIKQCGLENVANALDAGATAVFVIDDQRVSKRKLSVADNGKGMDQAEFNKAFSSVRRTLKKDDQHKFGQDGLGFISGLGKCEKIRYVSRSRKKGGQYLEYTLETEKVRSQDEKVFVPFKVRHDLVHKNDKDPPNNATVVGWSTLVEFDQYSKDPFVHGIDSAQAFADAVEERYGVGLKRNKAKVTIRIIRKDGTNDAAEATGTTYKGKRLGRVVIEKPHAGPTVIDLYLARSNTKATGRPKQGVVKAGRSDNDFRMPLREVLKTSPGLLPDDVAEGLLSGIFEGEILFENAERLKNRKGFEDNQAFVEGLEAVEQWFNEHGRQHLDEARTLREGERYQEFGKRLLERLKDLPAFEEIAQEIERGTVGPGHYDPDQFDPLGEQPYKSVSIEGTEASGKGEHQGGENEADNPRQERQSHRPLTSAGPHGRHRITVRDGSTGLQIVHDILPGSDKRCHLDIKFGILTFNVRHPDFQELEGSKVKILQYELMLAQHEFALCKIPVDWDRTPAELALEDVARQNVHTIKHFDFSRLKKKD
jgi:hypothetical protein